MAFRAVSLGRVMARSSIPRMSVAAPPRVTAMTVSRRTMAGGGDTYEIAGQTLSTEQLVVAVCGFYFSLYLLSKVGGGKKKEEAAAAVSVSVSSSIPSIIDEGFEKWAAAPGNMAKWEKSLETAFE